MRGKVVAFNLVNIPVERERAPVRELLNDVKKAIEEAGLPTTDLTIYSLGHGRFGTPVASGTISISVWPDRHSKSSWQIWISYTQPALKRLLRAAPPKDLDESIERTRRVIEEFLPAIGAENIQWISGKEALERLPK